MTYLAIARKYRPATFDEIVGQEHVTRTLRNAISGDRIHHAYLFTGARGVGKTTAARALARALNCKEGPTATPCGVCTSCTEIASGTSPDLIEIDGASNNSVDDVREIREAVQYAPSRGKWKIYLVDEVHMLSKGAFNALLKTLEEPPPHVVFIFATTEPNKIPDTILSRVQRFDFKRIPVPKVVERLAAIASKEGVEVSEHGLRLIARAGEGSMRDAQSLLDQVIAYGGGALTDEQVAETLGLIDRRLLYDFLAALVHGDPAKGLEVIEQVYGYGYELAVFTEELLEVLRHATFLRLSPEARRFVDLAEDEVETLAAIVAEAEPERLSRLFTALLDVNDQVARAGRPRIVLEMAVARLATTRPAQPVSRLLGRLEELERGLRGQGATPGRGRPTQGRSPTPREPEPRPPRSPQRGSTRGSSAGGSHGGSGGSSSREPSTAPAPRPLALTPPPEGVPIPSVSDPPAPEPGPPDFDEPPPPDDVPSSDLSWGDAVEGDLGQLPLARPTAGKVTRRMAPKRAAPAGRPPPSTGDPVWDGFCAALRAVGPRFEPLLRGASILEKGRLRVTLRAGRELAEARRLLEDPAVAVALAASYPAGTSIALEARRGGKVDAAQLEREFLADPALRRIVQALGATVERVEPLGDLDPPDLSPRSDP